MARPIRALTRRELEELLAKYGEMIRLRELHAAGEPTPIPALRSLAVRFPGVLREIDELPMQALRDRESAVRAALPDPRLTELWMLSVARYHAYMRVVLSVRRHRRDWTTCTAIALQEQVQLDAALYEQCWSPPGGRLNRLVFELVAKETNQSPAAVEGWLLSRRPPSYERER